MVTTMSSSAIRSSIVNSPSSLVISVRRSSPYVSDDLLQLVLHELHALRLRLEQRAQVLDRRRALP